MKNIGNYVFWTVFCVALFAFVYAAMVVFGAVINFAEAEALGIAFGITAVVMVLNATPKTKKAIREFFRMR